MFHFDKFLSVLPSLIMLTMSKIVGLLAAVFLFGMVFAVDEQCVEKPCTREYNPVAVISASICTTFANPCFLENAIRCGRVAADAVCVKGDCQHRGEAFPCPGLE